MDGWKQYILSIIVASLICGILSQMVSGAGQKRLVRLVCGIALGIVLLQPLSHIRLEEIRLLPEQTRLEAETYVTQGRHYGQLAREERIKAACEAYILDKAKVLGGDITAEVSLNADLIPVFAVIHAEDQSAKAQLQAILQEDLGIPMENQQWIWNQEDKDP